MFAALSQPPVTDLAESPVEFVRLVAILVRHLPTCTELSLRCELDEGVDSFLVACSSDAALFLTPYLECLQTHNQDASVDQPFVPVRFVNGQLSFDLATTEDVYPSLRLSLDRFLNAGSPPRIEDFVTDLERLSCSG